MDNKRVYQFYAELDQYEPKIWRTLRVSEDMKVSEFVYTIQSLFEMKASHLYSLELTINEKENYQGIFKKMSLEEKLLIGKKNFLDFDLVCFEGNHEFTEEYEYDRRIHLEATKFNLNDVIEFCGSKLNLEYDSHDWGVNIILEEILEFDKDSFYPCVLEGDGFGIIEDCGGSGGLERFKEAYKIKSGEEYENFCLWLGNDELDLETFDLDDANFRLQNILHIYRNSYELNQSPSDEDLMLMDREYKLYDPMSPLDGDFDYDLNRNSNDIHINNFEDWLKNNGLVKKTINRHISNIDFYINDFLCDSCQVDVVSGCYDIDSFLGEWFTRKALWASSDVIKQNIASIKKFYVYMLECNHIEQEDYNTLIKTIKICKSDWLSNCDVYDINYY